MGKRLGNVLAADVEQGKRLEGARAKYLNSKDARAYFEASERSLVDVVGTLQIHARQDGAVDALVVHDACDRLAEVHSMLVALRALQSARGGKR